MQFYSNFESKFAQAPLFLLLSNLLCFFNKRKLFYKLFFTKFLKLNPDPTFKSSQIRNHIEKNCWIRFRKNECGSTAMPESSQWIVDTCA